MTNIDDFFDRLDKNNWDGYLGSCSNTFYDQCQTAITRQLESAFNRHGSLVLSDYDPNAASGHTQYPSGTKDKVTPMPEYPVPSDNVAALKTE